MEQYVLQNSYKLTNLQLESPHSPSVLDSPDGLDGHISPTHGVVEHRWYLVDFVVAWQDSVAHPESLRVHGWPG
jgi:hypothetical protein